YELDLAEAYGNYESPADLDLPALRRDLSDTEQQLSRLGPVNLAAIDELKDVEARAEFLGRQFEDLSAAKDKLVEIIEHINDISRKLFKRTYKEVRGNFQDLFRKLYGGGKADLILQLDDANSDVLEAGVEIMAQPPGKQPKSITLLSGGEKALTAIALLFAVYQTKPSPFCILDEVDAPLDESNTDVYCTMVREFVRDSQFLVITHNKRTMQHADAIYGITQQERGVSTKISVKLEDIDVTNDGDVKLETAAGSDEMETQWSGRGPFAD
ncbi:MAG: chromosome segregation protein SMC, partial [Planctomycetota bacterium]